MLANLLRRGGPLLASALVLAAAVASLFGSEPVQRLVNSVWFLAGTGAVALASLLVTTIAVSHRSWSGVIQHFGLVVALTGVAVNQKAAHSDYLFIEQGAGASNLALGHNLRRLEELPEPLALESLTSVSARAFRPSPVAWVTVADGRSVPADAPLADCGAWIP